MTGREQDETSAEKLREVADDAGVDSGILESGGDDADVPPDSSGYSAPPLDS